MNDEKPSTIESLADVAFFLLFLKREQPNALWGGISVQEAWEGLCALVRPGNDPDQIEQLLMTGLRKES